jgi:hypothetical protein
LFAALAERPEIAKPICLFFACWFFAAGNRLTELVALPPFLWFIALEFRVSA